MKRAIVSLLFICCTVATLGKESPLVMFWPNAEKPSLKLTFAKFQLLATIAGQGNFVSDVTIENLTAKVVPRVYFNVYVKDKASIRIGEGVLTVADIQPSQQVKTRFQFSCVGTPGSLELTAKKDMLAEPGPKTVPLKVVSVPTGASLKVDGLDAGLTPVMVR